MSKVEVEISCCLCSNKHTTEIEAPDGWRVHYGSVSSEHGFCPEHSKIEEFTENCSGCVGGWVNCNLWRAFAYQDFKLTDSDFAIIRSGKCPKRTNGTMFFSREKGIEYVDISSPASNEAGDALAKAILAYHEKYHVRKE